MTLSVPPRALSRRLVLLVGALTLAAPAARAATFHVAVGVSDGYSFSFSPSNLTIHAGDTVTWTNSTATGHNVKADDGSFRCANGCDGDGHGGDGMPAGNWMFSRTFAAAGTVGYHCEVHGSMGMVGTITVQPAPLCTAGPTTLCVGEGGRFKVEVSFASATQSGPGNAVPVPSAPESGLFYFFNAGNIEMLVKVLNACGAPFNRYWVFYAATTNVEFTLTVTDTQSGRMKVYSNALNQVAAPIQDTDAFATCP